jgi:hypothetical protein
MKWNTAISRTATGFEKSITSRVSGWSRIACGSRRSAVRILVIFLSSSDSRDAPCAATIGSLST